MYADTRARMFAQRLQRLLPSPSAKHLSQDAEGEGEQHPRPVHFMEQHVANAPEIESPVHPIENGSAQKQRQNNPRRIAQSLFHAHKGTNFLIK